jgi:hypothetical protein
MIEFPTRLELKLKTAFRDLSWGAAPPYANVEGVVSLDTKPFTPDYHVCLRVWANPMKRILFLGGAKNKVLTIPLSLFSIESTVTITRDAWYAVSENIEDALIIAVIKQLVMAAAPRLYEADPRIGTCDQTYPALPLFDPPNGVDAMRRIPGCPLCGQEKPDLQGARQRVWGGGNIGWVHPTCLAAVYP